MVVAGVAVAVSGFGVLLAMVAMASLKTSFISATSAVRRWMDWDSSEGAL
jgi:hypothetical protein